jgi:hypothetical protein
MDDLDFNIGAYPFNQMIDLLTAWQLIGFHNPPYRR